MIRRVGAVLLALCGLAWLVWPSVSRLAAQGSAAAPRKMAFLVGVKNYDHADLKDLDFPEHDVEELASVLKGDGFQVVLLTTQGGKKDAQNKPTSGNIRSRLKALLQGATKQDLMIVGLAGHGLQPAGSDESYFCPSDALPLVKDGRPVDPTRLISLGEVLAQMSDAGIGHKLVLVDACRNDPSVRSARHRGLDHVSVAALPSQTGVLLSCSPGEYSFEDKSLGGGHGVFFYHVIEGLRGKAKDANDEVTWDELSIYVRPRVQSTVKKLFGKDGGEQSPNAIGNLGGAPAMLARVTADISAPLSSKPPELLVPPFDQAEANKFRRTWSQYQQIEEELKNSVGMQLTLIPAGRFAMGSNESPAQLVKAFPNTGNDLFVGEQPVHRVTITRPFYMSKCEVTVDQFRKFVTATDYKTGAELGKGVGYTDVKEKPFEIRAGFNWQQWGVDQKDDWPVINVTWFDANAFCNWLSKKDGRKYRLPTEAEWEFACRAGTANRYYNGDDPEEVTKIGNVSDATAKAKFGKWAAAESSDRVVFTGPVAQYTPNNFGLFDMLGNAREWCSDRYSEGYYKTSPEIDPTGPAKGAEHVVRGGGWDDAPVACRSSRRLNMLATGCSCACGFRVVAEPSPHNTPESLAAPFGESEARTARKAWARYHEVPEQGKNTIGMQLVLIPPGRFSMGSTPDEIEQTTRTSAAEVKFGVEEHPQHRVRITKPFYLANSEVTKGHFKKFVEETGFKTEAEKDEKPGGTGYSGKNNLPFVSRPSFTWRDNGTEQTDESPVINVSWNDAMSFCEWLGKKDGKSYRLPTEAEWEYACRAGTTALYYNGDDPEKLTQIENTSDKTAREKLNQSWLAGGAALESSDGFAFSSPVRHFQANNFGLYDMLGNAREWCADWYDADYYANAPGADPKGPENGTNRSVRGGSWLTASENCRCGSRTFFAPTRRFANLGFRLVLAPPAVEQSTADVKTPPPKGATPPKEPASLIAPFGLDQAKTARTAWARFRHIEEEPKNTLGIQFCLIPPGEFSMGSTPQETKRAKPFDAVKKSEFAADELPQHRVRITRPFYLETCEVTKGNFRKFVDETGYKTDAEKDGKGGFGYSGKKQEALKEQKEFTWRDWGVDQSDESPVVNVSWNDAVAFSEWLSKKDGKTYRLPTEAEWEYGGRAGTTTAYYNGDDPEKLTQIGNVADKTTKDFISNLAVLSSNDGFGFTAPVGKFPVNNFGLHDMAGNVWEWCQDWYANDYYAQAPKADPAGPPNGWMKVFRGGGWNGNAWRSRSAARDASTPSNRFWSRGFRLVLVPPAPTASAAEGNGPTSLVAPFDAAAAGSARTAWAKYRRVEEQQKNSLEMEFVLIPPGEFLMGSTPEQILQAKRADRTLKGDLALEEQPQHQVELSRAFYIGTCEVTKGQFKKFVDETGYKTEAETDGKGGTGYVGTGNNPVKTLPTFNWQSPGFTQADDHPVVDVSWNDAAEFCDWLSRIEGKKYRLPTEAEWEYACRAGTTSVYYNGDAPEHLPQIANVFDASGRTKFPRSPGALKSSDGWSFTCPVGRYQANVFGLFDMSGNVIEWCQDWFSDEYYATSPATDPAGPADGYYRVARGGSWGTLAKLSRSATRLHMKPDSKQCSLGFRVVCETLGR